jgi:hypothetical protein
VEGFCWPRDRFYDRAGRTISISHWALDKAVRAAEIGGSRLIVVDAIDDAAYEFYKHFDFIPVKNHRGRLVMKMSTAASALRAVQDEP